MTTEFYKQSPGARLAWANEAEQVFDELSEAGQRPNSCPWGISDPPLDVAQLPPFVRYAPDRLTTKCFYECKGVGRDGIIKIKLEQLYTLQWWDTIHPVMIFIWDSYRKRYTQVRLIDYIKTCEKHGSIQQFPDNLKLAWFMHVNFLDSAGWVKR